MKFVFNQKDIASVRVIYNAFCKASNIERDFDEEMAKVESDVVTMVDGELHMDLSKDPVHTTMLKVFTEHAVENMPFYVGFGMKAYKLVNSTKALIKEFLPETTIAFEKFKSLFNNLEAADVVATYDACSADELRVHRQEAEDIINSELKRPAKDSPWDMEHSFNTVRRNRINHDIIVALLARKALNGESGGEHDVKIFKEAHAVYQTPEALKEEKARLQGHVNYLLTNPVGEHSIKSDIGRFNKRIKEIDAKLLEGIAPSRSVTEQE